MATRIAIDAHEIDARRQALRWLANRLQWERSLVQLRAGEQPAPARRAA